MVHLSRQHWQSLAPHAKELPTAMHLLAIIGVAERLLRENNRLEMENREHRLRETPYEE